jgi:hypothetical protein
MGGFKMEIKLATFTDLGNCNREDINQLISALIRVGYEVFLNEDYICFKLGNDDLIEEK